MIAVLQILGLLVLLAALLGAFLLTCARFGNDM